MRTKRAVLDVIYKDGSWVVKTRKGRRRGVFRRKVDAVAFAAKEAREMNRQGRDTQAVIHDKQGHIQEERTYGNDPPESKG